MSNKKIPFKIWASRAFGWDSFLSLQKPSTFIVLLVPALALIRTIAEAAGHAFDLPIRLRITIIGTVLLAIAYALVYALCPATIRKTESKKLLSDKGGFPELAKTMEEDAEKFAVEDKWVANTVTNLLQNVTPAVVVPHPPTRGALFAALATVKTSSGNLDKAIVHARDLLRHTGKGWQFVAAILVFVGTGMIIFNFLWAVYLVLNPAEVQNANGVG